MGNVGGFPGVQKRSIRGIEFQHRTWEFLSGIRVHFTKMHHGLAICDVLQVHVGLVQFHSDGLFLCDVAWDGFQFSYLVIAIGGFKAELSSLVRGSHFDGILRCKFSCFRRKQSKGHTCQGSLFRPGLMAGDFAPQQLVVELHSGGFLGSYGDGLARWNLVPGSQLGLLLCHGVLAGGQVFDVDRPRSIGGEGFGIALALH